MWPVDVSKYMSSSLSCTLTSTKSKISLLAAQVRFTFRKVFRFRHFAAVGRSNHGAGHDSAVGLWLSSLLEGHDRPGGEGFLWLQPETSVV